MKFKSCFFRTLSTALALGGVLMANAGDATPMSWTRTWLDAIEMRWSPPVNPSEPSVTIPVEDWLPAFSFDTDCAVTFSDGKYIYSGTNPFHVYDMEGNYLRSLTVPGLPEMYQMTSDGRYMYGTVYERPGIFMIDMTEGKLIKVIPTKDVMYYLTYVPSLDSGKGGFFVGNPIAGKLCAMDGTPLAGNIDFKTDFGSGIYCQAASVIGDNLYVYSTSNSYDRIVHEYDLSSLKLTGKTFDLNEHIGAGGVVGAMKGRSLFTYSYPPHRTYLMMTDYSGIIFKTASILVQEQPLVENLTGYNIYKNGTKVNEEPLTPQTYMFKDSGLEESMAYNYEVRPLIGGSESSSIAGTEVMLDKTTELPLVDDFKQYPLTQVFPTHQLPYNYWTIAPKLPEQKWVIKQSSADDKTLQFSYSPDLKYRQTITSRPLDAPQGKKTTLEFKYAGNTYVPSISQTEYMSVDVSTDGGETWTRAGSVKYKSDVNYTPVQFDLTPYVEGKRFQIRFKGYGEEPDGPYNWQIDDVRIWDYTDTDISGKVNIPGMNDLEGLKITLTRNDAGPEITTDLDSEGKFTAQGLQTGMYTLRVFNDAFSYTVEEYAIDDATSGYEVNIPGGYFVSDAQPIDIAVAPGDTYVVKIPVENAGNLDADARVTVEYDAVDGTPTGNSDIKAEYSWNPKDDFSFPQNLSSFIYYDGFYYSKSSNWSAIQICRHSDSGELLETITLTPEGDFTAKPSGYFVKDGELYAFTTPMAYSTPPLPAYIIPVDLSAGILADSRKTELKMQDSNASVTGIDYNPKEDAYYAIGNSNTMYKLDSDGNLLRTYTFPEVGYRGVVIDTFSEGGPYLWTAQSSTESKGYAILQYSFEKEQFTTARHEVNEYEKSIFNKYDPNSVYTGNAHLAGSTELVPGHFSLILSQSASLRTGNENQMLSFPVFAFENWVSAGIDNTTVQPGRQSTVTLTLSAEGLEDAQEKLATLKVSASNFSDPHRVPVKLRVGQSAKETYKPATSVTAATDEEYNVCISWEAPASEEPVSMYQVLRDGVLLPGSTETTSFNDIQPKLGKQTYTVKTVYESGYSILSESVETDFDNPNWGVPVHNLDCNVIARKNVAIKWDGTPRMPDAFFDDFESYEPFQADIAGEWTMVDYDRSWTYENTAVDYPNEGERMTGLVYNPSQTLPADAVNSADGSRQFFCFTSGLTQSLENDKWLITPEFELRTPGVLRFQASSRSASYGKEKMMVGYSTEGTDRDDFIWLTDVIAVEPGWTDFEYEVPAETKHVAFRYVGLNTYMLFIDNVYVGPADNLTTLDGFNVYRNGEKLNEEILTAPKYIDYALEEGEYTYEVESVYANGGTARRETEPVTIDLTAMHNAPRNLDVEKTRDENLLLTWSAPAAAETERLRYDNGEVANSIGGDNVMYVAVKWDEEDIRPYIGYSITAVHFHIAEDVENVTPLLYEDGELLVIGDTYSPKIGQFNDYVFIDPLLIREGHSYMAGYMVETTNGHYPLSHDAGPGKAGKSDLLSVDGKEWMSLYEVYQTQEYSFNWCLAADLDLLDNEGNADMAGRPAKSVKGASTDRKPGSTNIHRNMKGEAPSFSPDEIVKLSGYNVYANGNKLNADGLVSETTFITEIPEEPTDYYVTAVYSDGVEKESEHKFYNGSGISGIENDGLRIYPTPVDNTVNIEGNFDSLTLWSLDGIRLQSVDMPGNAASLDMSNCSSGIYLLHICNGDSTSVHRIIKK